MIMGVFFAAQYKILMQNSLIILCAFVLLLVIRPLAGYISLHGANLHKMQRFTMSFFGIRGLGSIFYIMYAFTHAAFESEAGITAFVLLTILLSSIIHGIASFFIMGKVDGFEKENSTKNMNDPPLNN